MVKGIFGGIIAVVLIGIAAFLWNSSSDGGLVHALGGVTSQDLAKQITIPGPQGPQGPAGPAGPKGDAGPPGAAPAVSLTAQTSADYDNSGPVPGSEIILFARSQRSSCVGTPEILIGRAN